MGTARFLLYMTAVRRCCGCVWNWLAPGDAAFDAYPFIFLTLMLSLQASYAAPLILLAQNRQEDRDRVIAEGDRLANSRAHADMEFLAREMASLRMALGEVATRDYVRSELRALLPRSRSRCRRGRGRCARGPPTSATRRTRATSPPRSLEAMSTPIRRAGPGCPGRRSTTPRSAVPSPSWAWSTASTSTRTARSRSAILLTVSGCPMSDRLTHDVTAAVAARRRASPRCTSTSA